MLFRNQTPHSMSWRTRVYYAGGPRGVNTPSSEPQRKGLQSFYRQTVVGNTSCLIGWFKLRSFVHGNSSQDGEGDV